MNKPAKVHIIPKVMAFMVLLAAAAYALLLGVGTSIGLAASSYSGHPWPADAWDYAGVVGSYGVFAALAFVMAKCVKRWFY